jgi:aspartyl protease
MGEKVTAVPAGKDAFVDTGAQLTVLSTRAALALGLTETALAHDRPTVTSGATAGQLSSPGSTHLTMRP